MDAEVVTNMLDSIEIVYIRVYVSNMSVRRSFQKLITPQTASYIPVACRHSYKTVVSEVSVLKFPSTVQLRH